MMRISLSRLFLLLAVLGFCSASLLRASEAAAKPQTPQAVVEALYATYLNPDAEATFPALVSKEMAEHLTGKLKEQVAAMSEAQVKDESFSLGYDPLLDGQDFEIKEFKAVAQPERKTDEGKLVDVEVTFENFGEKRLFIFRFLQAKDSDRWLLSQVACKAGTEGRSYDVATELEETLKETESHTPNPPAAPAPDSEEKKEGH